MGKGFWGLLRESITEYGQKFASILKVFLFLYLIPLVVITILTLIFFASVYSSALVSIVQSGTFDAKQFFATSDVSPLPLILFAFVVGIIFAVFYFWTSIAYINISLETKKDIPFNSAFKFARKNFWRYVGLVFLTIILLIPLFILLIVPGIIFLFFWMFSCFILLKDNSKIWESMKKSKALVSGKWWRVFGYSLLIFILLFIASFIFGSIPFVGSIASYLVFVPIMILFFKNFYLELKKNSSKR